MRKNELILAFVCIFAIIGWGIIALIFTLMALNGGILQIIAPPSKELYPETIFVYLLLFSLLLFSIDLMRKNKGELIERRRNKF